jgi:hypothetical protein
MDCKNGNGKVMTRPYMINGGGGGSSTVEIINQPVVEQLSESSVKITVTSVNIAGTPTSYKYYWEKFNNTTLVFDAVSSKTDGASTTITGLAPLGYYMFKVEAYDGAIVSATKYAFHTMAGASINSQMISSVATTLKAPSKSYMELSVSDAEFKLNKYAIAHRSFSSIVPPSYSTVDFTVGSKTQPVSEANSVAYYTFGGSILMKNSIENANAIGGIGFFIDSYATKGYYIIIETTASAASKNRKAVRIVKFYGNNIVNLRETGTRTESTIEGIYGGRSYNIDVKVKVELKTVTIDAYVNGYKISYTDSTANNTAVGSLGLVEMLKATNQVALLCGRGTVAYDYVYGNTIEKKQYDEAQYTLNLYKGQFNNDLINTEFGDLIYTDVNDEIDSKGTAVDEFGTVVREIAKASIKFDTRPSYPVLWSTGANSSVSILGQKVSSFGAEAYVLNNSSSTVPLADDIGNSFYVYGNTLGSSGTLEYVNNPESEYATVEPVIFESAWLQNLSDVKSLADWIKTKTVNRGKVVTLQVFGNPLISVGDIVSIKYVYEGFAGTESLIVTNVNQSYSEGLETNIVCRSL